MPALPLCVHEQVTQPFEVYLLICDREDKGVLVSAPWQ